jgi:hypothetical protein
MRKYVVDEAEDSAESLQETLTYMADRGWRLVSVTWVPRRTVGRDSSERELNAQYTVIFEQEINGTPKA